MGKNKSPYVTRSALEGIKQACHNTDSLAIEEEMLLWTPEEARRFFESGGQERPDPIRVSLRSPSDKKPPGDRAGPRSAMREVVCGCFCPCLG